MPKTHSGYQEMHDYMLAIERFGQTWTMVEAHLNDHEWDDEDARHRVEAAIKILFETRYNLAYQRAEYVNQRVDKALASLEGN